MGEYNARSRRKTPSAPSYSYLLLEFLGISTIMRSISGQSGPGSRSYSRVGTLLWYQRVQGQHDEESYHGGHDLHGRPGFQRLRHGHAEILVDHPEAGIVDVGKCGAAATQREHQPI